ncbi:MAG: chemotaxis protein CheW [Candidatus Latescibacteria bacterium]|nr:chemotaxis protein CheW [Candidatus Latescibacterota bacterium]
MRTDTDMNLGTRGALTFRLGDYGFAVRVEEAAGLIDAERLAPLPGQVGALAGVAAFRGEMVPVIDLAAYLGIETPGSQGQHYALVLARGLDRFGILIPDLPRLALARELRDAPLSTADPELGELFESMLETDTEQFHCLNYWRIFETIIPPAGASLAARAGAERGS